MYLPWYRDERVPRIQGIPGISRFFFGCPGISNGKFHSFGLKCSSIIQWKHARISGDLEGPKSQIFKGVLPLAPIGGLTASPTPSCCSPSFSSVESHSQFFLDWRMQCFNFWIKVEVSAFWQNLSKLATNWLKWQTSSWWITI